MDVDANQRLAAAFGIQGIPAVKAFRDGKVASEFTGALPPAEVERFFDALVPSEADELAAGGDEESLRRALEVDPRHRPPARELARLLIQRGDTDEALELLEDVTGDFVADGLAARARLAGDEDLDARLRGLGPRRLPRGARAAAQALSTTRSAATTSAA